MQSSKKNLLNDAGAWRVNLANLLAGVHIRLSHFSLISIISVKLVVFICSAIDIYSVEALFAVWRILKKQIQILLVNIVCVGLKED